MALRIWRTAPWNRNPLMRPSDRLEGMIRILAVLVMAAAIPVAGAIGTVRYTSAVAEVRAENAAKVEVPATIVGAPRVAVSAGYGVVDYRFQADVRWNQNGRSGESTTSVPSTAMPGGRVTVWLGPNGLPTTPPLPTDTAALRGIGLGVATLIAIWGGAMAVVWLTVWVLRRRHRAGWAREWHLVSRPIEQDKQ
jgi:hypothetical protein